MQYVAAFDAGTTAVKGVAVSDEKKTVFERSLPLETVFTGPSGEYKEQDPRGWYRAFCEISAQLVKEIAPGKIRGIIMSGQMQDVIPVDETGEPLGNAILYSDGRAAEEAAHINALAGEEEIRRVTGNALDASIPAAKLLWLKKHEENRYGRISKVLGSSKDFIILKLCGKAIADVTAASTLGLMDIHAKRWDNSLLEAFSISPALLPELFSCGERCGKISREAAAQTGFMEGTPVYAGAGDAGASTLSAGITRAGEYNIYLGTSGWIAAVSNDVLPRQGVFNLAAIPRDLYINVVPFLNAGGVHKWISGVLWRAETDRSKYDYVDSLLETSESGSGGLLFLPYLSGERFPVMDTNIRGAYIGIGNETTKTQMARACLEGAAFSIRQGLEAISSAKPQKISFVGGGAKTAVWRQILADVLGTPVSVPAASSEYLPSIALTSAVFIDQGLADDYNPCVAELAGGGELVYQPSSASRALMDEQYRRYVKVYPALKELFA
jgi:xylulokinase